MNVSMLPRPQLHVPDVGFASRLLIDSAGQTFVGHSGKFLVFPKSVPSPTPRVTRCSKTTVLSPVLPVMLPVPEYTNTTFYGRRGQGRGGGGGGGDSEVQNNVILSFHER